MYIGTVDLWVLGQFISIWIYNISESGVTSSTMKSDLDGFLFHHLTLWYKASQKEHIIQNGESFMQVLPIY